MCSGHGEPVVVTTFDGREIYYGTDEDEYAPDAEHAAAPGPLHPALIEAYRRGYEDRARERDYDPGLALDPEPVCEVPSCRLRNTHHEGPHQAIDSDNTWWDDSMRPGYLKHCGED